MPSRKSNLDMLTEVDTDRVLRAHINGDFVVTLNTPMTSGFEWKPRFDPTRLKLLKHSVRIAKKGFGASSKEQFKFRAIHRGDTSMFFELVRKWSPGAIERKDVRIHVE